MTTYAGYVLGTIRAPSGVTLDATNSGGGPTSVTLPAADYTIVTLCAALQTALNAARTPADWTVTVSTTTGLVTIGCAGATPFSIAWTSTDLRDVLGFAADISAVSVNQVGTKQARFLWIPDSPLAGISSKRAPRVTDLRTTTSPTGVEKGFVGTFKYRHEGLFWQIVTVNRAWIGEEITANESWERFVLDAHLASGHAWGIVAGDIIIVDDNGFTVGSDHVTGGWQIEDVNAVEATMLQAGWEGLWTVKLPAIVSDG